MHDQSQLMLSFFWTRVWGLRSGSRGVMASEQKHRQRRSAGSKVMRWLPTGCGKGCGHLCPTCKSSHSSPSSPVIAVWGLLRFCSPCSYQGSGFKQGFDVTFLFPQDLAQNQTPINNRWLKRNRGTWIWT